MPQPKSRRRAAARTPSSQATLSFGSHHKVTKPSASRTSSGKGLKDPKHSPAASTIPLRSSRPHSPTSAATTVATVPEPQPEQEPEARVAPTKSSVSSESLSSLAAGSGSSSSLSSSSTPAQAKTWRLETAEERRAAAVTEDELQQYWQEEDGGRIAPRVHQEDVDLHEKILRNFDTSLQYGPCVGISRTARWRRAARLGLNPPVEVLSVLLREQWNGDKDVRRRETAQVDALLS